MPQETGKIPEDESRVQYSGEVFFTERVDGKTLYYCAKCKKGPFRNQQGLKVHLSRMHKMAQASMLRRRFVKQMQEAETR